MKRLKIPLAVIREKPHMRDIDLIPRKLEHKTQCQPLQSARYCEPFLQHDGLALQKPRTIKGCSGDPSSMIILVRRGEYQINFGANIDTFPAVISDNTEETLGVLLS